MRRSMKVRMWASSCLTKVWTLPPSLWEWDRQVQAIVRELAADPSSKIRWRSCCVDFRLHVPPACARISPGMEEECSGVGEFTVIPVGPLLLPRNERPPVAAAGRAFESIDACYPVGWGRAVLSSTSRKCIRRYSRAGYDGVTLEMGNRARIDDQDREARDDAMHSYSYSPTPPLTVQSTVSSHSLRYDLSGDARDQVISTQAEATQFEPDVRVEAGA